MHHVTLYMDYHGLGYPASFSASGQGQSTAEAIADACQQLTAQVTALHQKGQ